MTKKYKGYFRKYDGKSDMYKAQYTKTVTAENWADAYAKLETMVKTDYILYSVETTA